MEISLVTALMISLSGFRWEELKQSLLMPTGKLEQKNTFIP